MCVMEDFEIRAGRIFITHNVIAVWGDGDDLLDSMFSKDGYRLLRYFLEIGLVPEAQCSFTTTRLFLAEIAE